MKLGKLLSNNRSAPETLHIKMSDKNYGEWNSYLGGSKPQFGGCPAIDNTDVINTLSTLLHFDEKEFKN